MNADKFVAERIRTIGSSGIRRVFDLGASLKDPIDLSIGQPDFDVPPSVREAMKQAVDQGRNGYTVTRGLPPLRERIAAALKQEFGWEPDLFVTSGVSGGLLLSMMSILNAGEQVIFPDPYFVSYPYLTTMAGGEPVPVPLYDTLHLDADRIGAAITPRTKAILICSPANPTGIVFREEDVKAVCEVARKHDLLIISDEIYSLLSYDGPAPSPVKYAPERTILLRGFGKSYGMTGWRMGYAAGPAPIITEMAKLQQYTFVCAPHPAQWAGLAAIDTDMSSHVSDYRAKRDLVCSELDGVFDYIKPAGGFYLFPKAPESFSSATTFVEQAISNNVLIIPGEVFSGRDTHFRISYAAPDEKIRAGCAILKQLAKQDAGATV